MRKFKKGDEVIVLTGKNKGKRGVILKVIPGKERVVVENINMVKRHTKGNPQQGTAGGIIEQEMPLSLSNVGLFNPVSEQASRVGIKRLADGKKVRFFKSNNEIVDV